MRPCRLWGRCLPCSLSSDGLLLILGWQLKLGGSHFCLWCHMTFPSPVGSPCCSPPPVLVSLMKTPVILDAGPAPFQCGCILTGLHLQRLDLQKGSYSQVLGLKTFNISFVGNTVKLQQLCKSCANKYLYLWVCVIMNKV